MVLQTQYITVLFMYCGVLFACVEVCRVCNAQKQQTFCTLSLIFWVRIFKWSLTVNLKTSFSYVSVSLVCCSLKIMPFMTGYYMNIRLSTMRNKIPRVHTPMKRAAHAYGCVMISSG